MKQAKNLTAQGQIRREKQSSCAALPFSCLTTAQMTGLGLLALSLSTFLAYTPSQSAWAQDASGRQVKDFKHRKRLVVPATETVRRIDYQSLPGRDSLMLPTYVPKFPPAGAGGSQRYTNGSAQTPASDPYASGLPQTNNNQDGMLGGELSATAESLSSTPSAHKPIGRTSRAGLTPPPPPIKSSLLPNSLTKELPSKTATVPHSTTSALSPQKVAQVKAQAEALVKKGKPAEAQSLLSGYLKSNPNEKTLSTELSKISLQRAQSHAKAGNHEAATEQARLAITHGEHAPEITQAAHTTLNSSLQKIGVKANAPEDRFDLGTKLMGQARYDEAVIEYSAAAKLKPTVEAYLGAGGAAMKGGHQLQAKKYFQDALELNPDSEPALRELGIARYHLKDYAGANADLTRALVINSSDKEAASTLLELWHHQVASRPTDANSHLGLARAYQVAGDLPAAQNEYKTVVKIHPQHPNLPAARQSFKLAYAKQEAGKAYDLAKTLESQGSLLSAYQKASEAVHLYPSEPRYQSYCAQLAAKMQAAAQNPAAANALNQLSTQQSTLIPGSTPEAPPVLIPTAQAIGLAPAAVPGASVTPLGNASGHQQLSTDSQVNSMSNFLVSLRNFTMQQQNQIQAAEDSSIWKAGTSLKKPLLPGLGGEEAADTAIASAPSGIPVAAAATAATAPQSNSVADVLKNAALALANTNSSASVANTVAPAAASAATSSTVSSAASSATNAAAPAAAAAAAQPSSYASWAMQAQEAYKTSGIGSLASMTAGSAPALLTGKLKTINKQDIVTAAQKAASRFTTKPAAAKAAAQPAAATSTSAQVAPAYNTAYSSAPMPSPVPIEAPPQYQAAYMQGGYQAPQQLAAQQIASQQLASQPMAAPQYDQIAQMNSLQTNNQQLQAQLSQANSYIQQLQSRNAPAQAMPPQTIPGQQVMDSQQVMANQQMMPSQQIMASQQAMPGQQMMASQQMMPGQQMGQPSGSVRLLLQGVKAAKDDVQLKVLLINETGQEIKLPSNLKASVRSSSQGERQGKASFSGKTVNPGASVSGTIKIAGSNLDPTADVVIPASSLAVVGMGDLHLTVPISQR